MPIPIEYTSIRRMSTITVPKQDINFDVYDFQLCHPQSDIKDAFESRELEASFCRDFACCGLVLNDLHDLLQHYEECHVRFEDDESSSFYDESSDGSGWSPSPTPSIGGSVPSSPVMETNNISTLKKKAAAYLSDYYSPPAPADDLQMLQPRQLSMLDDNDSQLQNAAPVMMAPPPTPSTSGVAKKRPYSQTTPSALDLLTQSAAKKLALATGNGDLPTPLMSDEELLAQAGVLLASATTNVNADKPYKCPVPGCDKAYKNPNGLKYHNQHGHCNLVTDESENVAKPYRCTIGDCGKRYKNLNGLKYHIEHSHVAALNQTLAATFGSSLFQTEQALASLF